jgi:hypothetical protein
MGGIFSEQQLQDYFHCVWCAPHRVANRTEDVDVARIIRRMLKQKRSRRKSLSFTRSRQYRKRSRKFSSENKRFGAESIVDDSSSAALLIQVDCEARDAIMAGETIADATVGGNGGTVMLN